MGVQPIISNSIYYTYFQLHFLVVCGGNYVKWEEGGGRMSCQNERRASMTWPKLQTKSKRWNHNHSFQGRRGHSKHPRQTSLNPVSFDGGWKAKWSLSDFKCSEMTNLIKTINNKMQLLPFFNHLSARTSLKTFSTKDVANGPNLFVRMISTLRIVKTFIQGCSQVGAWKQSRNSQLTAFWRQF